MDTHVVSLTRALDIMRCVATGALLAASLAAPATGADALDWAFYDDACSPRVVSRLALPCGPWGVLHFGIGDPGGCVARSAGREVPRVYPLTPRLSGDPTGGAPYGDAEVGGDGWVAVLDWGDWHGASVSRLIETMADGHATSALYRLDDPALLALGETVGDQHVLANLCRVISDEARRPEPLLAVNMSFGRLPRADDPVSSDCAAATLACQVARLVAYLRLRGAVPVAAAGNYRKLLFPAQLAGTLSAAPLDLYHYGPGIESMPLWEAPGAVDAIVPGHGLCIDGRAAPAGSSYAAALFSGWLAQLAVMEPGLEPFHGRWAPVWSAEDGCFVLAQDDQAHRVCNGRVLDVLAGVLLGGEVSGCWDEGLGGRPVLEMYPLPAEQPPDLPGLDAWVARGHHPAPESDPCIPCVGRRVEERQPGLALLVNVSAAVGIHAGVHLDRMYLRSGDSFYPLGLAPGAREVLETGRIGGILLLGLDRLPRIHSQPSLVFVLRTEAAADCDAPLADSCYWTSTPVMLYE